MYTPLYLSAGTLISCLDPHDIEQAVPPVILTLPIENKKVPYRAMRNVSLDLDESRMFDVIRQLITDTVKKAQLDEKALSETAVLIGSTSYSLYLSECLYRGKTEVPEQAIEPFTLFSSFVQSLLPTSLIYTFNTACTSSANALIYGAKLIRSGQARYAIALGLEFYNSITLLGFDSLALISSTGEMRPYAKDRDGLILGEGSSAIVLSAEKLEEDSLEFITGATLSDTYSITATNPDGSGIEQVIRSVLNKAAIKAEDIKGIKLHGTASLANDESEYAGLKRVFKDDIPPVCALKPMLGHTLGACGTNELVVFQHYLKNNRWPAPINYQEDEQLRIGLANTNIVREGYYLLNYFGFGGSNTVLLIRK